MDILQDPVQDSIQDPVQDTSKNHSKFISKCLDLIIQSPTSQVKAIHAKTVYDYMTTEAFNFVIQHPLFKSVAIKKAYDLKIQCDLPELHNSLNCFLTAFGSPLDKVDTDKVDTDEVDTDNVEVEL